MTRRCDQFHNAVHLYESCKMTGYMFPLCNQPTNQSINQSVSQSVIKTNLHTVCPVVYKKKKNARKLLKQFLAVHMFQNYEPDEV